MRKRPELGNKKKALKGSERGKSLQSRGGGIAKLAKWKERSGGGREGLWKGKKTEAVWGKGGKEGPFRGSTQKSYKAKKTGGSWGGEGT